ncbi:antitoxin YezG family protein [Bacillus sp. PK3-056]|uniref:immunity protein YezG family protein n=1 Tax=Niallia circulans TaxID=1397 RepID=UPI0002E1FDD5|nr:immunity protein YezG family protein [Niallia circulans]AYV70489.1 cytoplasmic protein [Niallia circulans]UQZ77291.1 cytoplasmic protein [Niallia circulans]
METKQMEAIYQKVANILVEMIPEEWEKILLYAEVREGFSQVFFYYYPVNQEQPVYSLDIVDMFNIDKPLHRKLKQELYDCFEELWNEFMVQDQELWTSLTYILDNMGRMKLNYGYDDVSEISPDEKQDKWEAEYLK